MDEEYKELIDSIPTPPVIICEITNHDEDEITLFNENINNVFREIIENVNNENSINQNVLCLYDLMNEKKGILIDSDFTNDIIQILFEYIVRLEVHMLKALQIIEIYSELPEQAVNLFYNAPFDLILENLSYENPFYSITALNILRNILYNEKLYPEIDNLQPFVHALTIALHTNNKKQIVVGSQVFYRLLQKIHEQNQESSFIDEIWDSAGYVLGSQFEGSEMYIAQIMDLLLHNENFMIKYLQEYTEILTKHYQYNPFLVVVCSRLIKLYPESLNFFNLDEFLHNLEQIDGLQEQQRNNQVPMTLFFLIEALEHPIWEILSPHVTFWLIYCINNNDSFDFKGKLYSTQFVASALVISPQIVFDNNIVGDVIAFLDDVFDETTVATSYNSKIIDAVRSLYFCSIKIPEIANEIKYSDLVTRILEYTYEDDDCYTKFEDFLHIMSEDRE
ncbi:hypothetical protein TVAG_048700 [Trichomonas vaginalis G3]|uniref:Uncharacterized protein n=1 Tax=Trichomonas vaginalis (strain ATCC PRA-98 / G3) TaxID=412133 RepID=A2FJD1_TRIV3|nr:armadillo (ARM) repeat-containing protein family [Trichomonas vaginalis G3]EAX94992.1 hypothetical protein TVAG_048700 [Trichomonas vaginalis G3]KAI5497036.1 armadillo (ARM) repeat-containing protein family [Trichomonas vaginalis G3]|eukprot:XP_001307922.1 hypothetical protein [Trichomonas vaginalis G3]